MPGYFEVAQSWRKNILFVVTDEFIVENVYVLLQHKHISVLFLDGENMQ